MKPMPALRDTRQPAPEPTGAPARRASRLPRPLRRSISLIARLVVPAPWIVLPLLPLAALLLSSLLGLGGF